MPVRMYRIVHERMLIEWLQRSYPPGTWRTNVRLGMPHPEVVEPYVEPELRRMTVITTPQADAIAILPAEVHIIECLVRPEWWKILMLKVYGKLFSLTEQFKAHWHKPVELILLCAISNPFMQWIAKEEGIRIALYRPPWIEAYLQTLAGRKRIPPKISLPKPRKS